MTLWSVSVANLGNYTLNSVAVATAQVDMVSTVRSDPLAQTNLTTLKSLDYNVVMTFRFNNNNNNNNNSNF